MMSLIVKYETSLKHLRHSTFCTTMSSSQDLIIEHPNGSDGWLPAEQPKQDDTPKDSDHSTTPLRRTSKRKLPRTSSASRQPEEAITLIDTDQTPGSQVDEVSEEELKNRALSANNSLTPKQRSKIAKSEGQFMAPDLFFFFFFFFYANPLFSKGRKTYFKDHKGRRKDREAGCGYRHQRARRTSKVSKERCQSLFVEKINFLVNSTPSFLE